MFFYWWCGIFSIVVMKKFFKPAADPMGFSFVLSLSYYE
ncbi:hypothetical protein BVAVS116_H0019 (plasmid) [Borreliella valaisiana VS116]|uniref:Uncharacterized protein n=1 Tax=Borreliella valaisiana VS116 TaxID=445987 RepID=C0R976_BORVA|nr:hypothetical protein BVAVS116_H0019 [Borreliella valaisiana VS116]